ncbi:conserved hypothetical protein [Frankia canadensis]|uniref:Uncharacterized protein n=1 Tax=Frankia canadensis TaxID=1836972 RepID=A0A2I2KYV7_9ACTN|nr:DUF5994 family protein [Frankia canadensis]SNQ50840.1 conserved hypothetical protein [Frankia canadensis]SOU58130.1 conserved hypothetical protein [Frankia canadensis]
MTTGQITALLDHAESARFDDDGAPATLQGAVVGAPAGATPGDGRLSWAPARGQGSFDGAWWPRSWRLTSELPPLIAALSTAGETIRRMSVNGDTWTDIPHWFTALAYPPVKVSWYRTLDPHTVTLSGGNRPRLFLLVIPPQTALETADEVRRMATAGRLIGPAGQILRHAGATSP